MKIFFFSLFLYIFNKNQKNLDIIPIAFSLDDNYIYPTIVSITTIMINKNYDRKYNFYIMHPGDFKNDNKIKLKSLEKKYKNECTINLINMNNSYKLAPSNNRITLPTYYRLSLSNLLPNIDKIIYLDSDTIVFKDENDV